MYDKNNVFAKIIRGELNSTKIYEDEYVLCFEDIAKSAPIHWLVVPKGEYTSFSDFTSNADAAAIANFFQSISKIVKQHNLDQQGYRLITNVGKDSGQTVFHFHVHILAGKKMSVKV